MHARRYRVLCLVLATALPGCGTPVMAGADRAASPTTGCPEGTVAEPRRAATLLEGVTNIRSGARALAGLGLRDYKICFGGRELGSVRAGGVLVLDRSAPEPASIARIVHLLEHVADGLDRFPAPAVPCSQQLEAVIAGEARAIAAEVEARDELGVEGGALAELAEQLRGLAVDERLALLERELRAAEPQHSPELAELMRSYAARCERAAGG
ncbi:hypothetical protein [Nannocystis pusilla]|uniref:Uncharacterized protein n=1 Tax=Nannocystis pusilla TaxID=889268 RepID=A0ABS7U1M8_9BACT|nr:hypothetical protein [Nannocystis pusilla]MBZ5714336.1 hypothetical protein [Nannocystis pusilla]